MGLRKKVSNGPKNPSQKLPGEHYVVFGRQSGDFTNRPYLLEETELCRFFRHVVGGGWK